MNSIEKAQLTLKYLSGNGKLNPEQAERFVDLATAPFPPVRHIGVRGFFTYPLYLYRLIRFKRINKKWEASRGRENPFKGGFTICRMKNLKGYGNDR